MSADCTAGAPDNDDDWIRERLERLRGILHYMTNVEAIKMLDALIAEIEAELDRRKGGNGT